MTYSHSGVGNTWSEQNHLSSSKEQVLMNIGSLTSENPF